MTSVHRRATACAAIKTSNSPMECSSFGQHATDASELRCRGFVERHDFDGRRERVDEAMQFSRSLSVSSVAKFGERDRTDSEVRRTACPDARAHVPMSAQSEADTVGIKDVLHDGSKGFRLEPTVRAGGLGMSSCHAPRQARNSAGHSSAGSRMTCFPSSHRVGLTNSSPIRPHATW